MYRSLPPVTRRRTAGQRISVQQSSDQQSLSISPVCSWVEISAFATETDIPVAQLDQNSISSLEEMVRQLQDSMKAMQQDTVRQAEFAKQQAVAITQQAETIARLEQQTGVSTSYQAPPPPRVPILGEATHVQEDTDLPTGPAPPPIPPQ